MAVALSLQQEFRSIVLAELEAQGLSQRELASRMGIKHPTVSRYLNGHQVPGADMMEKFFIALRVEVHLTRTHGGEQQSPLGAVK